MFGRRTGAPGKIGQPTPNHPSSTAETEEAPVDVLVPAIPEHVASGKTVFVDVTADWCITCKVNKRVALGNDAVSGRLGSEDVIAMRADWTKPNDAIAAYLAGFGRYGIPFNAVYGPGSPSGLVLPEILTPGLVLEALEKGGKG